MYYVEKKKKNFNPKKPKKTFLVGFFRWFFFGWVFYCQPWLKDIIVSGLLLALLTSLFWAFNQKKRSEEHLAKMMKDMESLTKAERMLQEMQSHMQDEREEREYHEEQQVST